jgi:hypothetical protein
MSYMLEATFHLRYGKVPDFERSMGRFVPHLIEDEGWRLIAAYTTITGPLTSVTHLWRIPDLEAFPGAGARVMERHGELAQALADASELITHETLHVGAPVSYDPGG